MFLIKQADLLTQNSQWMGPFRDELVLRVMTEDMKHCRICLCVVLVLLKHNKHHVVLCHSSFSASTCRCQWTFLTTKHFPFKDQKPDRIIFLISKLVSEMPHICLYNRACCVSSKIFCVVMKWKETQVCNQIWFCFSRKLFQFGTHDQMFRD